MACTPAFIAEIQQTNLHIRRPTVSIVAKMNGASLAIIVLKNNYYGLKNQYFFFSFIVFAGSVHSFTIKRHSYISVFIYGYQPAFTVYFQKLVMYHHPAGIFQSQSFIFH